MMSGGGSVWGFRLPARLGQHHLKERALLKLQHQSGEFTRLLLLERLWRVLPTTPIRDLVAAGVGGWVSRKPCRAGISGPYRPGSRGASAGLGIVGRQAQAPLQVEPCTSLGRLVPTPTGD